MFESVTRFKIPETQIKKSRNLNQAKINVSEPRLSTVYELN